TLRKSLEKRGVQVIPSVTVQKAEEKGGSWEITCSNNTVLHAESVLVCAGRKPNCDSLNLEKANVQCSSRGIQVDSRLRTTHPDIYAIGDVNGLSLLAHAGSVQGEIAALNALGEEKEYDGSLVPRCLYTWPEVASVGSWISDAQKRGIETKSHRFFFEVSGRAACEGETEGLIQIVTAAETSQILGAQMIGPHATELIHILSLAIRQKMRKADLQEVIFAHPTFSEGIRMALER
ncbi:MAG: NAD(P)/FAD-dependent oxidoreductase, partial [Elusimicrobia bacterium]|nr:NAD(P)/FAD-dependent oxidoreductase [Elusimicrobiota bacterium]